MSEGITANQLQSGVVTILSQTVELTDAQVKALPTSPLTLLAAQGAGKIMLPHLAIFRSTIVAPYSGIDASSIINLSWGSSNILASNLIPNDPVDVFSSVTDLLTNDGAVAIVCFQQAPNPNQGANAFFTMVPPVDPVNQPLTIFASNIVAAAATDYEGGDVGNKLLVHFSYEIVDLT